MNEASQTPSYQAPEQPPLPQMPSGNFWTRNQRTIIRIIIVAIIVAGAIIYAKTQEERKVSPKVAETTTTALEESKPGTAKPATITVTDQVPTTRQETAETIRVKDSTVTVVAVKGNGYTHLARRALAEYLRTTGAQELKAEHKIFIEDYLQKKITDKSRLFAGTEVSFSNDQIQSAIDAALKLSPRQLSNLTKYVQQVPSLR